MSDKLPHVEVHEAMCKSIGDIAKENEALKQRIKRLENTINQAWEAFFPHSSHREAAIAMHRILDEEVRKETKP